MPFVNRDQFNNPVRFWHTEVPAGNYLVFMHATISSFSGFVWRCELKHDNNVLGRVSTVTQRGAISLEENRSVGNLSMMGGAAVVSATGRISTQCQSHSDAGGAFVVDGGMWVIQIGGFF